MRSLTAARHGEVPCPYVRKVFSTRQSARQRSVPAFRQECRQHRLHRLPAVLRARQAQRPAHRAAAWRCRSRRFAPIEEICRMDGPLMLCVNSMASETCLATGNSHPRRCRQAASTFPAYAARRSAAPALDVSRRVQTELPGNLIAKPACPHLEDRFAAVATTSDDGAPRSLRARR